MSARLYMIGTLIACLVVAAFIAFAPLSVEAPPGADLGAQRERCGTVLQPSASDVGLPDGMVGCDEAISKRRTILWGSLAVAAVAGGLTLAVRRRAAR